MSLDSIKDQTETKDSNDYENISRNVKAIERIVIGRSASGH